MERALGKEPDSNNNESKHLLRTLLNSRQGMVLAVTLHTMLPVALGERHPHHLPHTERLNGLPKGHIVAELGFEPRRWDSRTRFLHW